MSRINEITTKLSDFTRSAKLAGVENTGTPVDVYIRLDEYTQYLKDYADTPTGIEREIMFYSTQEVVAQHVEAESIVSVSKSDGITSMEYSDDNGTTWFDVGINLPISVGIGDETLWRVSTYTSGYSSGNVIINSNLE